VRGGLNCTPTISRTIAFWENVAGCWPNLTEVIETYAIQLPPPYTSETCWLQVT